MATPNVFPAATVAAAYCVLTNSLMIAVILLAVRVPFVKAVFSSSNAVQSAGAGNAVQAAEAGSELDM